MSHSKSLSKPLFVLFLVVATELIGFGLIIPILPQIVSKFGVSGWMVGLLLSAYSLAQFFAAPFLGTLSDKVGRKPVLVFSKLGTVVAYCILAVSSTYWLFFIARLIDGFTGGNISVARAYVADVTTPENRSKGMAVIGIAFGVGFLLGPALGGFLFQTGSYVIPAIVSAVCSFVAAILTVVLLEEPETRVSIKRSISFSFLGDLFKYPVLAFLCGLQLVYMIIFSGFETTFSVYTFQMYGLNEHENSFMFLYIGFLALLVQGYLSRKTFSRLFRVVGIGFLLVGGSFWVMSGYSEFRFLLIFLMTFSVGIGLINVFLPTLVSLKSPPEAQGHVMGIYESFGSLARVIGPLIPYGFTFHDLTVSYRVYGVILVGIAVLILAQFRRSA